MPARLVLIDELQVSVLVPPDLPPDRVAAVRRALARPLFVRELRRLVYLALRGTSSALTVRISR
ncbi:MAG TPA: hypothetical protein VGJ05_06150 [Fimbriiglobus sp.]|jgi:hypothetical protein